MADQFYNVIFSEFLWGIVLGLLLAVFGAKYQSKLQSRQLLIQQREDIRLFCQDIVRNLIRVAEDMAEARRRSKLIHHDLLALIEVEIGIFGRNREHLIRLDEELRSDVRKYITDCALRRQDVLVQLNEFERIMRASDDARAAGDDETCQARRTYAESGPLAAAHKAMDELIATARDGAAIVDRLTE